MTSIRRRLTLGLALGCTVAFLLAGAVLQAVVSDTLLRQFDAGLEQKARALWAALDYHGNDRFEFDLDEESLPAFSGGPEAEYFHLRDGRLRDLVRSESLGEEGLSMPHELGEEPSGWNLALPDGRPGRALGVALPVRIDEELDRASLDAEPMLLIVVASSREPLLAELSALRVGLAAAALAALLAIAWSVAFFVRRGLAPLQRLRAEVERVDASTLSTRVDVAEVPDELAPVVGTLNELFARLEAAFARQRRITSSIAHELRTPIAELRMATDVARLWPADAQLAEQAAATAHEVAAGMSELVEAVMRYGRLESGQQQPVFEALDVAALADQLWVPHARLAAERRLEFHNGIPAGSVIVSDRGLLTIVLGNLFSNATSHATPGGCIDAALGTGADGLVRLRLGSACHDLRPGDLAHLTEPFWQADGARQDGHHSGLGLTLTEAVVRILGGRLEFELRHGRFEVTVVFGSRPGAEREHAPSSERNAGSAQRG